MPCIYLGEELYSTNPKLSFPPNCWNIFLINLPSSSSYPLLLLLPSIAGIVAYPLLQALVQMPCVKEASV